MKDTIGYIKPIINERTMQAFNGCDAKNMKSCKFKTDLLNFGVNNYKIDININMNASRAHIKIFVNNKHNFPFQIQYLISI